MMISNARLKMRAKRFITTPFFYYIIKIIDPLINLFRKGLYAYDLALRYRQISTQNGEVPAHGLQDASWVQPIIS